MCLKCLLTPGWVVRNIEFSVKNGMKNKFKKKKKWGLDL